MYEIDREAFGQFLSKTRKSKGLTQKQLAQQLFVSDKAVSKWERGLSLPDIALLAPLAQTLDVTVTELLQAKKQPQNEPLSVEDVEHLLTGSLTLATQEYHRGRAGYRKQVTIYLLCLVITAFELLALYLLGLGSFLLNNFFWTLEGLALLFGSWFFLTRYTRLPDYYDKNKISFVGNGVFRLNIVGVYFNNRNWPRILQAGRIWGMSTCLLFPVAYTLLCVFFPDCRLG